MNVFDSIPDGFFNCLASSANHRAYAGCLNTIYEQYNSAVSYRLPRADIRDSLTIYLLQNHIELNEDGTEDLSAFTKTLEENDISKVKALIDNGCHKEIMEYMLQHNQKLKQEIISLKEENK